MSNILLGNIIEVLIFIGSIIANYQINRRKYLYWWTVLNILNSLAFFTLNAYDGAITKFYSAIRLIILFIMYKNEKIVPSKTVSLLLGLPFLILTFINYKIGGYLGIIMGLSMFLTTQDFVFKKEENRYLIKMISDIGLLIYDIAKYDFVGFARHIVEVVTFIVDIYRVRKYGEKAFYKQLSFKVLKGR